MIIYKLDMNEYPTDCGHCPLCEYNNYDDTYYCVASKNDLKSDSVYHDRNKDCPLIKVMDILPIIEDKSNELQINDDWDGSGD